MEVSAFQLRNNVQENFGYVAANQDFQRMAPVDLVGPNMPDSSSHSTGSVSSAFKGMFRDPSTISREGLLINQPCLRLNNTGKFPEYSSYFLQHGLLTGFSDEMMSRHVRTIHDWISNLATLTTTQTNQIRVIVPDTVDPTINQSAIWEKYGISTEIAQNCNLTWRYGENAPGINGIGTSIRIEGRDIGNIITIFQEETPICIESGFGLETTLARLTRQHPLDYLVIDGIDEDSSLRKRDDASIIHLLNYIHGITPGSRDEGSPNRYPRRGLRDAMRRLSNVFKDDRFIFNETAYLASTISSET